MVATIYQPGTLSIAAVCDGPDELGRCPRVATGEAVPCAGFEIALSKDEWGEPRGGLERHHFRVPAHSQLCPLEARGVFTAVYEAEEGYFSPFAPQGP